MAIGDLFAPAYVAGDPSTHQAVADWQAANFSMTPEMIEATRSAPTTITNPGVGGVGQPLRGGFGRTTSTVPGSVDPEALRIYAQGGHYTPKPKPTTPTPGWLPTTTPAAATPDPRSDITRALTGSPSGNGVPLIRNPDTSSPLRGLMGDENTNTSSVFGSPPDNMVIRPQEPPPGGIPAGMHMEPTQMSGMMMDATPPEDPMAGMIPADYFASYGRSTTPDFSLRRGPTPIADQAPSAFDLRRTPSPLAEQLSLFRSR